VSVSRGDHADSVEHETTIKRNLARVA
jgi:hypothetical protein